MQTTKRYIVNILLRTKITIGTKLKQLLCCSIKCSLDDPEIYYLGKVSGEDLKFC